MLRCAFGYLLLGFSLGWCLLLAKAGYLSWAVWRWHPLHLECLLVGWMFHLSLGVAYWIFPRINRTQRPRSWLAWTSFGLLNAGVASSAAGALWAIAWAPLVGRLLECLALLLFALHLWPRIKPFDSGAH